MPSPLIHAVLPASVLFGTQRKRWSFSRAQWIRLISISVILANIVDLDWIAAVIWPNQYFQIHRVWGHNIFVAFGFSVLGTYLLRFFVSDHFRGIRGLALSASLVFSHLVLDSLGHYGHNGFQDFQPTVRLFWPFSLVHYGIPVQVFFVRAIGLDLQGTVSPHPFFSFLRGIFFCEVVPVLTVVVISIGIRFLYRRFRSKNELKILAIGSAEAMIDTDAEKGGKIEKEFPVRF